ncbi:host cell attachment protein [Leptospira perolatii]|uniref:Host cell attachment protein n=1 Tax=Leptospira perolatii TaxID=2023191 RepID=A0A2M9ZKU9_9LEPT|nr:host attachment protein [Leptospira perolatii]PJZ69419.1 host cell attachment protein [Leptospira perolatii]PJZ72573.1 host cell attachment protein [Leptospira perolatii]
MKRKWVVVANRSEAKIFEYQGPSQGLKLLQSMENPDGRLSNAELTTEKGQSPRADFDLTYEREPKRKVAEAFAGKLSDFVNLERKKDSFSNFILISEPGFMGMVLSKLDDHTREKIYHKMPKDIVHANPVSLMGHLKSVLA